MKEQPIIHLLKPGEYRVWCRPPDFVPGNLTCSTLPSKATCAVCLGNMRGGKDFKVSHVAPTRRLWNDEEP